MFTHTHISLEESPHRCEERDVAPVTPRHSVSICRRPDPDRASAEAFVRARFHRTHGAHVATFMPNLLLLKGGSGIEAALGYRRAEQEPLFLERYLDRPIEQIIAMRAGGRVRRSQIVEVGNFAASNSQIARTFMSFLAPHFSVRDLSWIVFTATDSIRKILASLGGQCMDLGAADGAQAANGPDCWGNYYARDPRVLAGYLPMARRIPSLWNPGHAD